MGFFDSWLPQSHYGNSPSSHKDDAATDTVPDMDKKTAEEILGFDSEATYTQAEMTERYHNAVSERVNGSATAEEMGRLDHAKSYLDSYFVEDPSVTLSVEEGLSTYEYEKANPKKPEYTGPGLGEMSMDAMFSSYEKTEHEFDPPNLKFVYEKAHADAANDAGYKSTSSYNVPSLDGDFPLWYQAVNLMVRRFPWRLAFVLVVGFYGFSWSLSGMGAGDNMSEILSYGLGSIFKTILIIAVIALNTIFGWVTNLIRRILGLSANKLLFVQVKAVCAKAIREQYKAPGGVSSETRLVPKGD